MAQEKSRRQAPVHSAQQSTRGGDIGPVGARRKTHALANRADLPIIAEIGVRLKQFRTAAGLTLEGLCAKSGVSRAMLSKVERGEKSPTLTVFARIAAGLDMSLSTLMGAEPDFAEATVIRADKRLTFKDPETGFERHILSPHHIDNGVELSMPAKAVTISIPATHSILRCGSHIASSIQEKHGAPITW
jgi:transcriptional regulator with XRE-family HTH domain